MIKLKIKQEKRRETGGANRSAMASITVLLPTAGEG